MNDFVLSHADFGPDPSLGNGRVLMARLSKLLSSNSNQEEAVTGPRADYADNDSEVSVEIELMTPASHYKD